MSDVSPTLPDDDDDLLAAEFVVGLLGLATWNSASLRQRRDPQFAARVSDWEERIAGLNDGYAEAPAPNLMPQIEARLFPKGQTRRGVFSLFWALGSLATAALAVAAFFLLSPQPPSLVASLSADAQTLRYEAKLVGTELTVTRVSGEASDTAHVHELWIIVGKNPPKSLGVVTGKSLTIQVTGADLGQVLAISLEPPGGSPTGLPTGPVLVAGPLTAL